MVVTYPITLSAFSAIQVGGGTPGSATLRARSFGPSRRNRGGGCRRSPDLPDELRDHCCVTVISLDDREPLAVARLL